MLLGVQLGTRLNYKILLNLDPGNAILVLEITFESWSFGDIQSFDYQCTARVFALNTNF